MIEDDTEHPPKRKKNGTINEKAMKWRTKRKKSIKNKKGRLDWIFEG